MIVDLPVVTDAYEAIAAALRPHAAGDYVELTFPQIVGAAAAAVDPLIAALKAERDAARAEAQRVADDATEAITSTIKAADDLISATTDALASKLAELEGRADWWRLECERVGARMAVLEELRVQAEARWGHEGGPSPLRAALDAARLPDGD